MTTTRAQIAQQMRHSSALRALQAQADATAALTRRADALLRTGSDRATVDHAVRTALTRDGALPAAQRPAPGAPAPLPRQTLQTALATASAGVALSMGVAHQVPGGLQDAPTPYVATTRENATLAVTQPRYGGARAEDAGLPTPAMVQDAVASLFGLPPSGSPTPPRRGR